MTPQEILTRHGWVLTKSLEYFVKGTQRICARYPEDDPVFSELYGAIRQQAFEEEERVKAGLLRVHNEKWARVQEDLAHQAECARRADRLPIVKGKWKNAYPSDFVDLSRDELLEAITNYLERKQKKAWKNQC